MGLNPFGGVPGLSGQSRINQFGGWSVASTRPFHHPVSVNASVMKVQTVRSREIAPFPLRAIRLIYKNWNSSGGTGEVPGPNPIIVRGGIQFLGSGLNGNEVAGDPVMYASFNGRDRAIIGRGKSIISDPIWVGIDAGQVYYVKSSVSIALPAAPSAPAANNTGTGGSLPAGTYGVAVTIAYPEGLESATSAGTSVAITGTQAIAVTSPGAVAGAEGWRLWCTVAGDTSAYYDSGFGIIPFGTNVSYGSPFTVTNPQSLEWTNAGAQPQFPAGIGVSGGTANSASNNGEGMIAGVDYVTEGRAVPAIDNSTQCYGPSGILGLTPDGINTSVACIGDSIETATWDAGYGNLHGGFMERAINGQFGLAYDKDIVPNLGHLWLSTGGETAQKFAEPTGLRRSQLCSLATAVHSDYGTNDYQSGGAATCGWIWANCTRFTSQGRVFCQSTLLPRTSSSDGWQTVANQTAGRNQYPQFKITNIWISDSTGESTVSEPLTRYPASITPTNGATTGGDGTNTTFFPTYLYNIGTEAVTVNGVLKAVGTDYIRGVTGKVRDKNVSYAIAFNVAPASGSIVSITYTKAAGLLYNNPLARHLDTGGSCAVDADGNQAFNGPFWKPTKSILQSASSATSYFNGGLTDSSKSWTVNQWRGYAVCIVSDPVGTNIGQVLGIVSNSATSLQLNDSWHPIPSPSAQYIIVETYTQDGLHPTTSGAILMAQSVDLNVFA